MIIFIVLIVFVKRALQNEMNTFFHRLLVFVSLNTKLFVYVCVCKCVYGVCVCIYTYVCTV